MDDWHPEELATIADRLGIAFTDLAPPCSRSFRTHGGPNIHVLDWGGQGPPAVLLHGGALTARTWDYVALALRADFRLVALDLRGHGASDWADAYPIADFAADVLTVIDGLRIERARLVGMSLGGMTACEFALRHPDRQGSRQFDQGGELRWRQTHHPVSDRWPSEGALFEPLSRPAPIRCRPTPGF